MNDDRLLELSQRAGISIDWTDTQGVARRVAPDILRRVLTAMDLPCASAGDISESRARLSGDGVAVAMPPLITASVGEKIRLPRRAAETRRGRVEFEQGGATDVAITLGEYGEPTIPAIDRPGYHRLYLDKSASLLAVAPSRCWTIGDIAPGEKPWGLTAQVHGLRRPGDGGIGDFGAVAALARAAAGQRADALSLSPTHALFQADPSHFTPYSPSSRLFHNVLLADVAATFDAERVAQAAAKIGDVGAANALEALALIDWPAAARARLALSRALYESFHDRELAAPAQHPLGADFARFRAAGGDLLEQHATFEALHAERFKRDAMQWHWRSWPEALRDPNSPEVRAFAARHEKEIAYHVFLQWLVDRSMGQAQDAAKTAGMRVGLVSDLAVGMNDGGSHAWSRSSDLLLDLSIGAPPDMLAPLGQDWGLTTFSPRALVHTGFAPFLATLRTAFRRHGGVRIDHVMGVARLWVVPAGAASTDGAYLAYPSEDLLRLIALESSRHRAIVIGEDLGTVPDGLRGRLAAAGIAGMSVLQFERDGQRFHAPGWYPASAVAMTSTHDTATLAGWWRGVDIETRAALRQLPIGQSATAAAEERAGERQGLWDAFRAAGSVNADAPRPDAEQPEPAIDAAVDFIAKTPASLVLLPIEDAIGARQQPNLPGTTDEHPNWRRRYPTNADRMLDAPDIHKRLTPLANRR